MNSVNLAYQPEETLHPLTGFNFEKMIDAMRVNILIFSGETYKITYANRESVKTLNTVHDLFPEGVNGAGIIGQSADIFYKGAGSVKNIVANLSERGHETTVRSGTHFIELRTIKIEHTTGGSKSYMLTWSVVTETERLKRMFDVMPINVMLCDPKTLQITYVNQTSVNTLRPLQGLLPVSVDQLHGTSIDVFHKHPEHQRKILGDPNNLPFKSTIKLGDNYMSLNVAAIVDHTGYYIGAMLCWDVVTTQVIVAERTRGTANTVETASKTLIDISTEISEAANSVSDKAETSSHNAKVTNESFHSVAAASEQLTASIQEIAHQMSSSIAAAEESVESLQEADNSMGKLVAASSSIGEVIRLINDIAEQINLLALNATIEAARAGDAGRTFAIVAGQIKTLAGKTESATKEITKEISAIQNASAGAVSVIDKIKGAVEVMNSNVIATSAAIKQQTAATEEITGKIQEASSNVDSIEALLKGIANDARNTSANTQKALDASASLSKSSVDLNKSLQLLLDTV